MFSNILDDLLVTVADGLTEPPERQFIGTGPMMAWDCEQLTVRPGEVLPQYRAGSDCMMSVLMDVHVVLLRCVPVVDDNGQVPSAEQMTEAGMLLSEDAREVFEAVQQWTPPSPGQKVQIISWLPLGPEGGYAGGEMIVRVRVI